MPNTPGNQQPFVERFEMAIMQYVILNKAQQGEVTRENLKQTFRGNLQMSGDHFEHCIDQLVQDKHLKEIGGKYTVTDDGREDVQKLQTIVMELPNVIQQGGNQQGQRQGVTQQQSAGGRGTTGGSGGGSTGSTVGNQGSFGSSSPQGKDVGSQSGSNQPGKTNTQSGVSGQQRTADVSKGGATRTER